MTAPEPPAKIVAILVESDVIAARHEGRGMAARMGFSAVDQARIATAISELARNIIKYGKRGSVTFREVVRNGARGVELQFDDEGPGIADVDQAMEQGFTTGMGLGAGLPGTKRLMDEFEIRSEVGKGVHIVVRKWL